MSATSPTIENLLQPATLAILGGPGVVYAAGVRGKPTPRGAASSPCSFRFKYAAVENLGKYLGESALGLMRIIESNERTAQRRREQGTLTADESDRIARIARIAQRAVEAFGNETQAREWMKRPNRALQSFMPLALLSTDAGAALVVDELGRIEYGDLY